MTLTTVLALSLMSQVVRAEPAKVTLVATPKGGHAMVAKTDDKGIVHLVFDTPDGPQYVRSQDDGKTLSEPIALVDRSSRKPGLDYITWDMSVTPGGTVHVALGNNAWKLKLPKEEWGFFYTRLKPGEKTFSPLKNINHKPSEGFSLAVNEKEVVSAVWMADQLFANISKDGGDTFDSAVEIDHALDPCNCCTTSSTYGADGRLAILYREETGNQRDMYLALWDQIANRVTKTRVSTTPWTIDSCPMTYYSVTQSGEGFVAAWPTKGQIYFAHLDADGAPVTPKETRTPGSNGMRTGLLTITSEEGRTLVAWKKENQLGWQMYDELGRTIGSTGSVKSAGSGVAGVLTKKGKFVLFQ